MRILAILVGCIVIGAATWAAIDAARLEGPHSALVAALAAGTVAGAVIMGRSTAGVRIVVIGAVLCGEAFGMLATAERILEARSAKAGGVSGAAADYAKAELALDDAKRDLRAHDERAAATVATRNCGPECRGELSRTRDALEKAVSGARNRIPTDRPAGSPTPLADRLGVQPWVLDLIAAGLLSVGANGLGCVLIAWGAHAASPVARIDPVEAPPVERETRVPTEPPQPPANVVPIRRAPRPDAAKRYIVERLSPSPGARTPVSEVVAGFLAWCERSGVPAPSAEQSIVQIQAAFRAARIKPEIVSGKVVLRDVQLIAPQDGAQPASNA